MSEINTACNCNYKYDLNINLSETNNAPSFDPVVIKVNFGEVRIGHEKSTKVTISNDGDVLKNYIVKNNPHTLSAYQCFHTLTRSFDLTPHETTKIRITYKPLIVWSQDQNFISILCKSSEEQELHEEIRLEASGNSIGPQLQISTNMVNFNTWPQMQSNKKALEIRNLSAFPVEFKFDVDDAPMPIFEIVPHVGIVDGNRHVIVNITFRATTFGVYSQRFFCMIHNHHPLMVDCFGVYWKTEQQRAGIKHAKNPEIVENIYDRYMRDVQAIVKDTPAFSFNDAYLNFGSIDFKNEKESTLVTTFTNHRQQAVIVKWYQDEVFKVTPGQIEIPAEECALFECNFRPSMIDNIYSRNLLCNIYNAEQKSETISTMPLSAILRVLGHSFSEHNSWVPQFQHNPGSVVLPPVLPGDTCFTTLELRSAGYLPTSFKFISPTTSNFLLKPMMGTVRTSTIVVVQLVSFPNEKPKMYSEQWHILLNNDKNHKIPICLKGYAAYPSVEIGQNNTIIIRGVQVGCEEVVSVSIRNTSQFHVHYEFMTCDLPDEVKILTPTGSLTSNSANTIKVSFKSSARVCKQFPVTCLVYAIRELKQIHGSPAEICVTINVEADHSDLCSLPSRYDFGTVECHHIYSSEFCLFNYGHTTIHYELSVYWRHVMEHYEHATVWPVYGTLEPKAHVHCGINFGPHQPGVHYARVCYKLRPDANGLETVENTEKFIYEFEAQIVNPYIQIIEIADHNFGPLFSKRSLWECLNINWLNHALAGARHNDSTMCIDLNLPDAEMNNKYFYVTLMARNVTQFAVQVSLKRKKLCDCELQEVGAFLSIRRRVYQCPHRQMCKLSIMEETISPLSVQSMTLQVNYFCEGETTLSYYLSMNEKRFIIMNFKLNAIGVDQAWLSKYSSTYCILLQPMYLNTKQANYYVYWFYNNTKTPVSYELNELEFNQSNKNYRFEVWKCLNPSGVVKEYESHPLLIHYHPLEKKSIVLHVPLALSDGRRIELHIRARGTRTNIQNKIPKLYLPAAICANVPVHLSMDRLRIQAFPVWSSTTRMIFITNMSDDILGYNWLKTEVAGICSVEVMDPNRVLRPHQTDVIVVRVKSYGVACSTRVHLPCQLISHTKYLQHQKSLKDYQRRQQEIQDEFIITDKGITYPENEVMILPEAKSFYTTLALELEIKSFVDRDAFYSSEEQFILEPQSIFPASIDTLPHKQKQPSIAFLSKPNNDKSQSSSISFNDDLYVEKNSDEFDPNIDNVEFYRQVIEALLADAIFSNRFRAVLDVQKRAAPIYYSQIRPQKDLPTDIEKHLDDMYNEPQMPVVKDVMHTMLLKSFDEIFGLKTKLHEKVIDYNREVDLPALP